MDLLIGWRCCDAWRDVRPARLCEAADEIDTCRTASVDVVRCYGVYAPADGLICILSQICKIICILSQIDGF